MKRVLEVTKWLVVVAATFTMVRLCVRSYIVVDDSMASTLLAGDVVLIQKLPLTSVLHNSGESIWRFAVVAAMSPIGDEVIIKRIVGVPGDTLEMVNGELRLNGRDVSEPWARLPENLNGLVDWRMSWQREYLVAAASERPYMPSRDRWGPIVVPTGSFFLLGDNRGSSVDSRQLGLISKDMMLGKVVLILASYERGRRSEAGERRVRWSRVLRMVR